MPKRKKNKKVPQVKSAEIETVKQEAEDSQPLPGDNEQDGMWLHPSVAKKIKLESDKEPECEKLKKENKSPSPIQDEEIPNEIKMEAEDDSELTKPKKKKKKNKSPSSVVDEGAEMKMEVQEDDAEPSKTRKRKRNYGSSSPIIDKETEIRIEDEEDCDSNIPKKENKKDQIPKSEILYNSVKTEEASEMTKKKKENKSLTCQNEDNVENVSETEEVREINKPKKLKNNEDETESTIVLNDLRDEYESNTEWEIRRKFLEAHLDSFPLDRLISLSKCFVYNEMYGNIYPIKVMNLLESLRQPLAGLIIQPMERLKSKYAIPFVKSSDTPSQTSSKKKSNENTVEKKGMINFVKADENYESLNFSKEEVEENDKSCVEKSDPNPENLDVLFNNMQARNAIEEYESKFAEVGKFVKKLEKKHESDPISRLYEAAQKCKMTVSSETEMESEGSKCKVFLNGILVGVGHGKNKKNARVNGHTEANLALLKPHKKFSGQHPKKITFVSSDEPFEKETCKTSSNENINSTQKPAQFQPNPKCAAKPDMKQLEKLKKQFPNFYVRELNYISNDETNYKKMLHCACSFHQLAVDFQTKMVSSNDVRCRLSLDGELITEARGETTSMAEHEAARIVFEMMKDVFWTMMLKDEIDSDGDRISKDEVIKDGDRKDESLEHGEKLTDSNIGCKLLRKMGWSGKGVGKNEQGREEPVLVRQVVSRNGLGQDVSTHHKFDASIRELIMDYVRSDRDDDLAFAPDFSNEERKQIHLICSKNGLKSKSYGSQDERYLVISRQRNKEELFDYVTSKGGETNKYKLIPPRLECFR